MKKSLRGYTALLGAQTLLLLYHTRSFLTTQHLAGRDLVGAYSLVKAFTTGWTTKWFLGYPMFRFYPPGFFASAWSLGKFLGALTAFKLLIYTSLLAVPLAAFYSFSSMYDRKTGLTAGFLAIFLTFARAPFSLVYQTLQIGLTAQAFAIPFFLLFLGVLQRNDRGSAYLSAVMLAFMILIHPFIAAAAILYTGLYLVLEKDLFRSTVVSLGAGMTAWWWIPILEKSWYTHLYTGPSGKLTNIPWIFLPFLALERSRKTIAIISLAGILLILGLFKPVPLQHYRAFIYGQLLLVLSAAPGLTKAADRITSRLEHQTVLYLICLSLLGASLAVNISPHWQSSESLENVIPEKGQVIVETSHSDLHNTYVPIQRIPLESNASIVNGLYADSSISSPYLLGIEKEIAREPIPNPLAVEADLTRRQLKERMRYFNISRALVRTDHARERLDFMRLEAENEDFKLLSWEPKPDREISVARVCISRERWSQLNRFAFREFMPEPLPLRDCPGGKKINDSNLETMLEDIREMEGKTAELEEESIRPESREEALFHLAVK